MQIGELFLDIGIKGTEKTVNAVASVTGSLKDAASMSLEAKAGVVALIYAFEKLTSQSLAAGTKLSNFHELTGIATDTLQRYEYVAGTAGASIGEMDQSLQGLNDTIAAFRVEGKLPAFMTRIGQLAHQAGVKAFNPQDLIGPNGAEKLFQWYQQVLSKSPIEASLKTKFMEGTGINKNVLAGMIRNQYSPEALAGVPLLSDNEIARLTKAQAAWFKLGQTIQKTFDHFTAKHGIELARDIELLIKPVSQLTEQLDRLTSKMGIWERLGHIFEGIGNSLKLVNETLDLLTGKSSKPGDLLYGNGGSLVPGVGNSPIVNLFKGLGNDLFNTKEPGFSLPHASAAYQDLITELVGKRSDTTVNQNLYFQHGGQDIHKVKDAAKDGIRKAFQQMNPAGPY